MSRWCSEQERKDTGGWPVNLGKNDQPTQSRPRSVGPARSCAAGQWNRPAGVALVTLGLRTDPADAPRAPPSVLQESAPEWSQGGVPNSARPHTATYILPARALGSRGKSWPWECPLMKKNLQAYKITFVWNVGVLKSSSVCFSPVAWISSAEAAGVMQKCEQRPSGIPKLQGN